ncbi:protein ENHANCED DISEASE RESISTANCE 2-like isoform X1 [Salvia splendens]|uniref:protein ENHANCED DISEASE RESISTANCE 2-like isoform X1 n=2 Tax=Salvia splendens TaxID=180675 RepID=UPI001C268C64|nr:protein ENHANCED DISEASE RESISTANCE 2-like isoform X1 [Salvia splendens]XP_042019981.1 protein ENHANCED DISEASE RESISTANCE 2-like isoform X1 [Salvia splendens]
MRRSRVVHEGWMVRYKRRKIGRSYFHMRYFVLEPRFLAYYKKKPQDGVVPVKTLLIDGNCRVEDQGVKSLKPNNDHMIYVLSVYNKKDSSNRMTMASYSIQEVHNWKEKLESIIDQQQGSNSAHGNKYFSFEYRHGLDTGRNASSSDRDAAEEEDDDDDDHPDSPHQTIGDGPPESVFDWTDELDSNLHIQNFNSQAFTKKSWRLLQCQNGLRIFEELLEVDFLPKSCSRPMKAVGVVEATCEETFELIMRMDATRCEWDCSFQYGSLVEEVDGHTAILYQRLQLDWFSMFVWPRDLCYVRYWRRNDDGSYVVLFRSREHESCRRQRGYVRAHIESGGFNISRLKSCGGRPRTKVQHLMQIDLRGWGAGYFSSFQHHCLLQMLNSVAGLREYFSQTDERAIAPRMPIMVNMTSASDPSKKSKRFQSSSFRFPNSSNRMMDECSDDDEDFQYAGQEVSTSEVNDKRNESSDDEPELDMNFYFGNLRRDDQENARNCWTLSDGNNFRVRGKNFCSDKSKTAGGKHLMDLVATDWFKSTKRMDHVAKRLGCAAQVAADRGLFSIVINLQVPAGSTQYSMIFYFVTKNLVPGSLLQRFVDGDDEARNSRLKLIPSVPKGSWIVRQSVGSTPCLLGKSVDCTYIRGPSYLEIDVDISSSTVANGVLGLVNGVITTLVVDMAFIVQGNTPEELPERLIGAVRISHLELSSALEPREEDDF